MKLTATELTWGGPDGDWWWILWGFTDKHKRTVGFVKHWYDGPISEFGIWIWSVSWRTQWTSHDGGMEPEKPSITSREMAIINLRHDPEVGRTGLHYFNVYVDSRTGENRTLFGRATARSAEWERQAVRDGWWGEKYLRPAYVVRVKDKAVPAASARP